MHLCADEQHVLVDARAHPCVRDGEPVEKSGALIAHVQSRHAGQSKLVTEEAAGAGEIVIG